MSLTNHCKWKSWMEAWLGKRHLCNLLTEQIKVAEPSAHTLLLLQLTCRIEVAGLRRRFTTDRKITIASYVHKERIHLWWRERESVGILLRPSHKCHHMQLVCCSSTPWSQWCSGKRNWLVSRGFGLRSPTGWISLLPAASSLGMKQAVRAS